MKISEMIKSLKYQLDTYGDDDVNIIWDKHPQLSADNIFFSRVISGYDADFSPDKVNKNKPDKERDGFFIMNYPY